jgi:excinuclease ABC subunit C
VGAVVAMKDGAPDKKRYRTFHVRRGHGAPIASSDAAPEGSGDGPDAAEGVDTTPQYVHAPGDDYAAMYDVLARRFRRGRAAHEEQGEASAPAGARRGAAGDAPMSEADAESARDRIEWELPDLFVVDGGRGQLGVALAAARDLGLHELPIVALAKEKENVAGDTLVDRVYLPGQKNPIALKSHSALRDEAHRFSNRARERLGKAHRFKSELDGIAGIGPPTKKALLKHLGTVQAVKEATDEALLAVPGVTARHVKALRKWFGAPPAAPVAPLVPPSPTPGTGTEGSGETR